MSWLAKLYETYEKTVQNKELSDGLEPFYHKTEQCHIEVIIDDNGNFKEASSIIQEVKFGKITYWKGKDTIIPITPKSLTGRTSGPAPYPLAEQIQYVAKDYSNYGGKKKSYFKNYYDLLYSWACSEFSHFKIEAICKYVEKGTVVKDLINSEILFVYVNNGKEVLITNWSEQGIDEVESKKKAPKPPILHAVHKNEQGNAKIRWRVRREGHLDDWTWKDLSLIKQWQDFQIKTNKSNGLCQIAGKQKYLAVNHPKGISPKANDAKLICSPTDPTYLTFQGKFTEYYQVCPISFEVSQKAHNALRWLISRQGYKDGEQIFVTWAVSGKGIPSPLEDSWSLLKNITEFFTLVEDEEETKTIIDHSRDHGQSFALQINKYLAGYRIQFELNDQIVVMGLDSATTGRMSITYYRELLGSEFFQRLEDWHTQFAWFQRHTIENPHKQVGKTLTQKIIWPVSAPVPRDIADAAYGDILKTNTALRKNIMERIIPCIVEGRSFPQDILHLAVKRASNSNNCKHWEWERNLGITCALYRGFYQRHSNLSKRRDYSMNLDENRNSRDYLYGRLLAIAERLEEIALWIGGENRSTNAARLMQRFADRPFSTWRTIELSLQPYMQRLQGSRAGFLMNRKKELDTVISSFENEEFTSDKPLTGEFLLGYHCQRMFYRNTELEIAEKNATQQEEPK